MTGSRPNSDGGRRQERPPKKFVQLNMLPDAGSRPQRFLAIPLVPLALSVVADQVPVVTAVAIVLASVALLSSAATLVLASRVSLALVADQPTPAVTTVVAGIALEACVCSADILAESIPANRASA